MPAQLPSLHALQVKAGSENFPVALRLLPRQIRTDLFAIYAFARLTDDIGDEYPGDRLRALDWLEADLIAAIVGQAAHPAVARLTPILRAHTESFALFRDLIMANRLDQEQARYSTFDDLLDYCSFSANPVGRLVLGVFAVGADDQLLRWSDDVCSGLQVVEHLQDVAEDHAAGRVYVPQEDLAKFGCCDDDLGRPLATIDVRRLVAFETERARDLLDSAGDLVARLPPRPRVAVAAFAAGGYAALDAIAGVGYEVLGNRCRPAKWRIARHVVALLLAAGPAMNVDTAYAECARITKAEAKNFAYGIALLPRPKRDAMSALYACARRIDDIADSERRVDDKLAALATMDEQIAAIARGELPDHDDAVLVGVHHAARAFPIPVAALSEIVEGCRRDATGTGYATWSDTEAYCRLVAGSVGRLSLGVFGHRPAAERPASPASLADDHAGPASLADDHAGPASLADDPAGPASLADDHASAASLADDLGVAMQLTNILRDIREDRDDMGRVYLPADDVKRFGCEPDLSGPPEAITDLVRHFVPVAEDFYRRGLPLLSLLDRRSRACVAAMAGIYHRLLASIAADPAAVAHERVSLSTPQKLWVAARSLAGASP